MKNESGDIVGAELDMRVVAGKGLVAKDGGMFSKKTSDPYCVIMYRGKVIGQTAHQPKTLDPVWDGEYAYKWNIAGRDFRPDEEVVVGVFDYDKGLFDSDDSMGEVRIPLKSLLAGAVSEKWWKVAPSKNCKKPTGELKLKVSCLTRRALSIKQRESMPIQDSVIAVGLGWDLIGGKTAVDLDTSCVAVSDEGKILMEECAYFAQLCSRSGAVRHTGDEKEGDDDLGAGDDEIIVVDLDKLPRDVAALFFIATVATEGRSFADVKSSKMRLVDFGSGEERCRYFPACLGAHTALFMCRVARIGKTGKANLDWTLQSIGESDHTARDWGTLVPEIKMYMGDLVKGLVVDPTERVAIMRKGGNVRLRDYCQASPPPALTLGLAWDVTDGVDIDLDASVIMLDANLQPLDIVFFGKLASSDGSVVHGGDEKEGDAKGDDERLNIALANVHPSVRYLGIVVNSYSGQELDDVKAASCHLYLKDDPMRRDLAVFALGNAAFLDGHVALLVGCLYIESLTHEWCFAIVSEAAQGRTAHDNVDELQAFLQKRHPQPLGPAREAPVLHGGMLGNCGQ